MCPSMLEEDLHKGLFPFNLKEALNYSSLVYKNSLQDSFTSSLNWELLACFHYLEIDMIDSCQEELRVHQSHAMKT